MLLSRARHLEREARRQRRASVVFSDALIDGQYRYCLVRVLDRGKGTLVVVMVNPSKAGKTINDHTVTKLIEFTRRLGYKRLIVCNLFAFRATDVSELERAIDPVGEFNNLLVRCYVQDADRVIVAWGSSSKFPRAHGSQFRFITAIARQVRKPLWCWGTTNDGHPKHPLRLAYSTLLERWKEP